MALFSEEELHLTVNALVVSGIESYKETPLLRLVHSIGHNLAINHLGGFFKDSVRWVLVCDINMVDSILSHSGNPVLTNPLPVRYRFWDVALFEFLLRVQIKHLDNGVIT